MVGQPHSNIFYKFSTYVYCTNIRRGHKFTVCSSHLLIILPQLWFLPVYKRLLNLHLVWCHCDSIESIVAFLWNLGNFKHVVKILSKIYSAKGTLIYNYLAYGPFWGCFTIITVIVMHFSILVYSLTLHCPWIAPSFSSNLTRAGKVYFIRHCCQMNNLFLDLDILWFFIEIQIG